MRNLPLEGPYSAVSGQPKEDLPALESEGEGEKRRLSMESATHEGGTAPNPFLADLTPRPRTCVVRQCGQTFELVPPILAHAACFSFFAKVETDPAVIGLTAILDGAEGNAETGPTRGEAPIEPRQATKAGEGSQSQTGPLPLALPAHKSPLSLTSVDHDRDLARLFACANPRSSPGLRPLFFAGQFSGSWEGRFCFFDFDSYREMLAGRMRSLYEGPFGEQPQVWKLEERIVRIPYGHKEGGRGPTLSAGYLSSEEEEALEQERIQEQMNKVERMKEHLRRREEEENKDGEGWADSTSKGKGKEVKVRLVL